MKSIFDWCLDMTNVTTIQKKRLTVINMKIKCKTGVDLSFRESLSQNAQKTFCFFYMRKKIFNVAFIGFYRFNYIKDIVLILIL